MSDMVEIYCDMGGHHRMVIARFFKEANGIWRLNPDPKPRKHPSVEVLDGSVRFSCPWRKCRTNMRTRNVAALGEALEAVSTYGAGELLLATWEQVVRRWIEEMDDPTACRLVLDPMA